MIVLLLTQRITDECSAVSRIEDETADRFVEILERKTRGQYVVVDPLLHEKRFQDKWKRPNGTDASSSAQSLVSEQNPPTNKFYPPMFISRVRTSAQSSPSLSLCSSVPAIQLKNEVVGLGVSWLLELLALSSSVLNI